MSLLFNDKKKFLTACLCKYKIIIIETLFLSTFRYSSCERDAAFKTIIKILINKYTIYYKLIFHKLYFQIFTVVTHLYN